MAFSLVSEVRKPKSINPNIQIIYSVPKAGKTTIISQLSNHLILELEPGGANYISGRIQEIYKPSEFNEALDAILKSPDKVCDHLIIDTITKLDGPLVQLKSDKLLENSEENNQQPIISSNG